MVHRAAVQNLFINYYPFYSISFYSEISIIDRNLIQLGQKFFFLICFIFHWIWGKLLQARDKNLDQIYFYPIEVKSFNVTDVLIVK